MRLLFSFARAIRHRNRACAPNEPGRRCEHGARAWTKVKLACVEYIQVAWRAGSGAFHAHCRPCRPSKQWVDPPLTEPVPSVPAKAVALEPLA